MEFYEVSLYGAGFKAIDRLSQHEVIIALDLLQPGIVKADGLGSATLDDLREQLEIWTPPRTVFLALRENGMKEGIGLRR